MKKRSFLLLVIVILATVALGTAVVEHPGYVLISWKNIRFEATLWIFVLCLLALLAVLYILRLLSRGVLGSNPWSSRNRQKRLQSAIDKGLLNYASGNWSAAAQQLAQAGKSGPRAAPYLLTAARAAEQANQAASADKLLLQAKAQLPANSPAFALCQADILLARKQDEQARQVLLDAYQKHPDNSELLLHLSQQACQQKDWSLLLQILPALRKTKNLSAEELASLEQQAWHGRISQPAQNMQQVTEIWHTLPKGLHKSPGILMAYCSQLITFKQAQQAEKLLRSQLQQQVDVQLLQAYAQIPLSQPAEAVKLAEQWLEQVPQDPNALYATGKICLQAELWGKARDYLQASLAQRPQPRVYAELARLLNQMGDHNRSIQLLSASINMQDRLAQAPHSDS